MSPRARRAARTAPRPPVVPQGQWQPASFRWGWYGISFLVPFGGILIALFLYDHDDKEVRRVGRNCLLIGFLFWVLLPLALLFILLVATVLSLAGWIGDAMDSPG